MELVLGPHARTDRTRNTRVAVPRLPAPEDGRSGEGQRLTPEAPHNSGRPPPPPGDGPPPHRPRGTQPPQGMQAKETVLGPHSHKPAPTARGYQTPTACPVGGQSGEGERLTSDAPPQPQPGRGEPGPDRPPPSTPDGARDRGRTRGGARTTCNGPTSAQCRDRARCARHTTQGRGDRTPRERERTHTQRARGDYQKGDRTELAECTDRVEWRTSERG